MCVIKKNILISAYAFYPSVGGLEEQMYLLSQEWMNNGHSVDVLTEKNSLDQPDFEVYQGISIYRIPFVGKRSLFDHLKIIHYISLFILRHRNKYDFCMLRAAITLYPLIFAFWKSIGVIKYKTFLTADKGGDDDEILLIKRIPFYKLLHPIYSSHDYYNCICEANYTHYKELNIPLSKLTNIPNGIVFNKHQYEFPKSIQNFLFLGRLFTYKGIHELLDAFNNYHQIYKDAKLLIGGIGPEEKYITKYIKEHDLEQSVKFLGTIDKSEKEDFFSKGDCLISPSYSEGFGLSIVEAIYRKKIIIATDVADLKKLFGEIIFFCKKKDSDDLFKTMVKAKDTFLIKKLNYDHIINNFNIHDVADKIISLTK